MRVAAPAAMAHPLGNFSINHLSTVKVSDDRVDVLYVLDEAEIPTTEQRGLSRAEIIARQAGRAAPQPEPDGGRPPRGAPAARAAAELPGRDRRA